LPNPEKEVIIWAKVKNIFQKVKRSGKIIVLKSFNQNEIHVHEYNGTKRSNIARKPSRKERRLLIVARYGKE
jgi:hypothetical protein